METACRRDAASDVRRMRDDAMSTVQVLRQDVRGYGGVLQSLSSPGFWAVASYRVARALHRHRLDVPARIIQLTCQLLLHCDISRKARIGPGLCVFHPSAVFIGPYCRIGWHVSIGTGSFIGANTAWWDPADYPIILDDVAIGPGAKILGGVIVGAESRIGPNAVVMRDVPDGSTVLPPASRIISREPWSRECESDPRAPVS